jgi:hypothetical protein
VNFTRFGYVVNVAAFIISGAACMGFLIRGYSGPLNDFVALGLGLFTISVALSATCYTAVSTFSEEVDRKAPRYAGEKFLHAGVLFLQAVAVKYAATSAIAWLDSLKRETGAVQIIASVLFFGTGTFGAFSFSFGFEDLSDWLWSRWVRRMGAAEAAKRTKASKVTTGRWREQWDRVGRYLRRFEAIKRGREYDDFEALRDDALAFFQNCHHLKDHLVKDHAVKGRHVNGLLKRTPALQLCADLANAAKHLELDEDRPRGWQTQHPAFGNKDVRLEVGGSPSAKVGVDYWVTTDDGARRDAFTLATECVAAWEAFLKGRRLL